MTGKLMHILLASLICFSCTERQKVDVLIIGGGASGTTAGIQSARMGVNTLIIEEYEWLGGALTSAGVSAIDGNYRLPAGLFGEFRTRLIDYYGSEDSLKKSWVSSFAAEPSAMNKVFQQMAGEEDYLSIWFHSKLKNVTRKQDS
jgi:cation diffusion facilitator CzcD-associated flavoprotein CzcO